MPNALFLLLLLACPLAMMFMMRGMHGGHGQARAHEEDVHKGDGHGGCHSSGRPHEPDNVSLDDLRTRRTELDHEIADRELAERSAANAHR